MFEDFTESAKEILSGAGHIAAYLGSDKISPEHLFVSIAKGKREDSVVRQIFQLKKIHCQRALESVIRLGGIQRRPQNQTGRLEFDELSQMVFEGARESMGVMGGNLIDDEHLVCGFANVRRGYLPEILKEFGTTGYDLRNDVYTLCGVYDLGE